MFEWFRKRARKSVRVAPEVSLNGGAPGSNLLDAPQFDYVIGLSSDVGCVRQNNEDNAGAIVPEEANARAERGVLVVVADGMGGHAGGEIASQMAVEIICREYSEVAPAALSDPSSVLKSALETANATIHGASRREKGRRGMGTTCTTLVLRGAQAFSAHVGDSRLYLLRGGAIYQLSQDHSAVMDMVRQGMLTIEQARRHENKNLITRALGLHPSVAVEVWDEPLPVRAGDRFLLSSDGLHDLVEDETINAQALAGEPQAACEALVQHARMRGGHDNITVALVHVREKVAATNLLENGNGQSVAANGMPVTREAQTLSESQLLKEAASGETEA